MFGHCRSKVVSENYNRHRKDSSLFKLGGGSRNAIAIKNVLKRSNYTFYYIDKNGYSKMKCVTGFLVNGKTVMPLLVSPKLAINIDIYTLG